ncbi:hypothetical protein D9M71_674420 [compost metagenome]
MQHRLIGEGQRQQVVELAVVRAVAQVLAEERDSVAVEKFAGVPQQLVIQGSRAAKGQRQAVAGQRETLGQLRQAVTVAATDLDPVVRRALQEIHRTSIHRQQFGQQWATQAKACTRGERSSGHGRSPERWDPPRPRARGGGTRTANQFLAWLILVNSSVGTFLPLEVYWLLRNL